MHTCETCGQEWPESYCPECRHSIGRAANRPVPPPLPQPPPIPPQQDGKSLGSKIFGIFKPRTPALDPAQPHPHHRNFARMFIPDALARHRGGFLAAMSDPNSTRTLQEAWQKCGASVLPRELLASSAGLSASGFRHENYLCLLIIFPPPKVAGESHLGFIVAGPSNDWSPDARAKVPVRYFLLERSSSDTPVILEWRPSSTEGDELFDALGPGPSPKNPPGFVETILTRFYSFKPRPA